MPINDIALKCIEEFQREAYIEKEDANNIESIKEDYIYFLDKRIDLYNFVYKQIKEWGETGLKF